MERYGCLILAVIVALVLLFFIVFLWSGWLNRPTGHDAAKRNCSGLRGSEELAAGSERVETWCSPGAED